MHQEIRLHGHVDEVIEYYATAASRDAFRCCFYEAAGERMRFFSPGNELIISRQGIGHRGNGGSFCQYMFGVDLPLPDLAKEEVRNRLVLYGATMCEGGTLLFSDRTEGELSYERIFLEGNAICNYFFYLNGSVSGPLHNQQEELLRLLGKVLKRSPAVGESDETELLSEMLDWLGHRSSLYLIKLVHKRHKAYHDAFRNLYFAGKTIPETSFLALGKLAEEHDIDRYQQERIRIDVMYNHRDNRRVVDEYKKILIDCHHKGEISQLENARLTRLKTLSVRNKIPAALFFTLDEMLRHDKLTGAQEQDYLAESRQILAGIFLRARQIEGTLEAEDMVKLLHAKRRATESRDHTFEEILLETGKTCDEKIRDGDDLSLLESFSTIVTYFDRYDNASSNINQLAFMENVRLSEDLIRSLLGNKKVFDDLVPGLFDELFFRGILENKYLSCFGRRKVTDLQEGLRGIEQGIMTVQDLLQRLQALNQVESLYGLILVHVKDRIRNFYSRYNTRAEQEALRREVEEELHNRGLFTGEISPNLFRDVVVNIKKEAVYLHNLLPRIISERDLALREDFLENSGLDRFYVEELEREYFEFNHLDLENLYQIRKGLTA
jgi:uncharacterized protein (TIGR04442 family)